MKDQDVFNVKDAVAYPQRKANIKMNVNIS